MDFEAEVKAAARLLRRMPSELRKEMGRHLRLDVAIGAARKVFSGGASVNQVLYGAEFSGGRRRKSTSRSRSGKPYQRRSTVQFIRKSNSYIYSTLERTKGKYLEKWVEVIDPFVQRWQSGG